MCDAKFVDIARLMTTYNLEIECLPNNLTCVQCRLILKDPCQLPCCCRFCRVCIDDMITRGDEFCPGNSEDCSESYLSYYITDYISNKEIMRLTFKCPHDGCDYKCQFGNIEKHLRECNWRREECLFRDLGCTHGTLAVKDMDIHLEHDNYRHSKLLIEIIAHINKEIESLKCRDENSSIEIERLKCRDEISSREIERLNRELLLKDEQIRSIMDEMIHVKNDIKSIKEENEDLACRLRILTEEFEREACERRENDELYSARVIEHVDTEIAAVIRLIGSNKHELAIEMQSVKGDIGLINQSVQSIKDDICSVKLQVQSVESRRGLDTACEVSESIPLDERTELVQATFQSLQIETKCGICTKRTNKVAFNCGHQACSGCDSNLYNCHVCRQRIETRIPISS